MPQDDTNQPIMTEEQPSEPNPAPLTNPASEQATTETQVAESVTEQEDEIEDEEEEETEGASPDVTTEAETSSPGHSSNAITTPTAATSETDKDERSEIERQPYDFDHCTVQIAIQLLPDDGDPNGRPVVVGVRSHLDAPILRLVRWQEIGVLPPLVGELLDAVKGELPAREQSAREAFEKRKAEKANRKAVVAAPKTTARGKKSKKATLASAPTANATVADNRPRPEVQVSVAPQKQMGLF